MTPRTVGATLLLALAGLLSPLAAQETPREIASRVTPAVVTIRASADGALRSTASGFLIQDDGVVVTNHHVIDGADELEVELSTGESFGDVYFVASSPERDLAVLRIPATQLPVLEIGDASALAVGDRIYVVGNPMGMDRTFTDGLVSARRVLDGVGYIQISAPISSGSSGGPVLDAAGRVVGVATASITEAQNLNLAVPIGYAEGLLSVGAAPRPFADVAREWGAGDDEAHAGIAASFAHDESDDLPPWQQSVVNQISEISSIVAREGFTPTDHTTADLLAADKIATVEIRLEPGTYKAVGVCDNDCDDLDLVVLTGDEELVGRDVLADAFPIVDFTVEAVANYTVAVQMVDCSTETCFYSAVLFRKD
jgi:hypothetical protein